MMNKSEIDWCDFTWNPITGCRHTCEYCYARKQAKRFSGDIRLNKRSEQLQETFHFKEGDSAYKTYTLPKPFKSETGSTILYPAGFEPTLHEYRLPMPAQKKKPANIFVCSMADLFGEWVPDEWIERVFDACAATPWHNYMFLTKNPRRLINMGKAGKLPTGANYWYGTTITAQNQPFFCSTQHNCFLSIEPLMAPFEFGILPPAIRWIIVGAETGSRKAKTKPEKQWIHNIMATARAIGAAVLIKDSKEIREIWTDDLVQEFPPELSREEKIIPRCDECEDLITVQDGKRGVRRACKKENRAIPAKNARTSPLWCPERK